MKNLIFNIIIIIFVGSCGYSPIMINENVSINFGQIISKDSNKVTNNLYNRMKYLISENSENKIFINSSINKSIASKNKKGNPEIFNIDLSVNLEIYIDNKKTDYKVFNESVSYSNLSSKFELKERENKIENSLTDKIYNDILVYLQSLER